MQPKDSHEANFSLVGAAVGGVGAGTEERVELLVEAGVDVICVDIGSRVFSGSFGQSCLGEEALSADSGNWRLNVARLTTAALRLSFIPRCRSLLKSVSDARLYLCNSRVLPGVGVPSNLQLFPMLPKLLQNSGVPLIADGGIRVSRRPC